MRTFCLIFIFSSIFFPATICSQCLDLILNDPSFELGDFNDQDGWSRDDGAFYFESSELDGEYIICSNSGGGIQTIKVLPNTDYHLSCWVKNGLYDFKLWVQSNNFFIIDTGLVTTNTWEQVSMPFNTVSDTILNIHFYSANACVDLFQVTCQQLTDIKTVIPQTKLQCYPNPTTSTSKILFNNPFHKNHHLMIYDLKGQLVQYFKNISNNEVVLTKDNLNPGIYIFQLQNSNEVVASGKWMIQ